MLLHRCHPAPHLVPTPQTQVNAPIPPAHKTGASQHTTAPHTPAAARLGCVARPHMCISWCGAAPLQRPQTRGNPTSLPGTLCHPKYSMACCLCEDGTINAHLRTQAVPERGKHSQAKEQPPLTGITSLFHPCQLTVARLPLKPATKQAIKQSSMHSSTQSSTHTIKHARNQASEHGIKRAIMHAVNAAYTSRWGICPKAWHAQILSCRWH